MQCCINRLGMNDGQSDCMSWENVFEETQRNYIISILVKLWKFPPNVFYRAVKLSTRVIFVSGELFERFAQNWAQPQSWRWPSEQWNKIFMVLVLFIGVVCSCVMICKVLSKGSFRLSDKLLFKIIKQNPKWKWLVKMYCTYNMQSYIETGEVFWVVLFTDRQISLIKPTGDFRICKFY